MWEGIGVVSFLLINFWYTRLAANKAAILAFTQNRLGDMCLSLGFFAMIFLFGTLDFDTIFSIAPYMNSSSITIISLLLLLGAMAKSSQIFLHNWLPGSMEGRLNKDYFLILIKPLNTLYLKNIFNTIWICTDIFTLQEVELFINTLKSKFKLDITLRKRIRVNKVVCWKIRFSSKINNIKKLQNLVKTYFIPSMLYKLNLSQ